MAGRERAMQVRWGCWLGILCLVAGCAVEEGGVGPGPRAVAPAANVAWAWQESATPAVRTASIAAIGAEVDWVVLCGDVERLAREMALPEAWRQQAPAWRAQWTAEVQRLTGLDLSQASPLGAAGLGPGAAVAYDGAREVWLVELSLADREAFRAWVKAWSGGAPLSWPPGVDEPTLRAHFAPFSLGGRYAPWRVVVVEGRDSGVILVSEAGDAALWQAWAAAPLWCPILPGGAGWRPWTLVTVPPCGSMCGAFSAMLWRLWRRSSWACARQTKRRA